MNKKIKLALGMLVIVGASLMFILLVNDLVPLIQKMIENKQNEALTINYVRQYGNREIPILFSLQVLQVFVPFIPTSLVEVLIGLCYGPILGSFICLVGLALANGLMFALVRRYHDVIPFIKPSTQKSKHKLLNHDFIEKSQKPELILIVLYLIPIFPNSLLAFLFEKTKITLTKYVFCLSIASVPSIILYTFLGKHLSHGNYFAVAILLGLVLLILLVCYLMRDKIMAMLEKQVK